MTKIDINWLSDDGKYQYAIDCMQLEIDRLQERYDNLKKEHRDTITRNEDYRARIDKAIEKYKECCKTQDFSTCDLDMYEALQGSDKE